MILWPYLAVQARVQMVFILGRGWDKFAIESFLVNEIAIGVHFIFALQ